MGYFYLGVQVPDAAEGLPLHPLAVILHISGKPLRSLPAPGGIQFGAAVRVDRRLPGKPGRDLDHGLVDHYRHRVQVVGVGFQPQPLGFQRDGTAARKGIQQGRRVVIGRAQDLRFGGVQHLRVVGVFPLDQLFQNGKQAFDARRFWVLLGGVQFRVAEGRPQGWTISQRVPPPADAVPTTGAGWTGAHDGWIFRALLPH